MCKKIQVLLIVLSLLLLQQLQTQAQGYTDEKRAQYLFYVTQRITWPDSLLSDHFRLAVLDTSDNVLSYLNALAQKTDSLHKRPVKILKFESYAAITQVEVLFVSKASGFDVNTASGMFGNHPVLIISDYTMQEGMVDFIEFNNQRRYILNMAKLDAAGLQVSPLLKAGAMKSREDWEREYYEGRSELSTAQDRVKEFRDLIREQILEIATQQGQIDSQKVVLTVLFKDIDAQKEVLDEKVRVLTEKETEILKQNQILSEQKDNIKAQEDEIDKQKEVLNEQLAQIKMQRLILYLFIIMLIMMFSLAFFIYRSYKIKKQANLKLQEANDEIRMRNAEITQQKEEIEAQRDEIERQRDYVILQRDQISKQKQEIMDSIHYASRIQSAILPPDSFMQEVLPEHFVLFRPRDIVSGDFYWITQKDDKVIFIAADCTGHGVPGAFMSMLGISFLNQIINQRKNLKADLILNRLRESVIKSLHQEGGSESKDGMDMALCIYDPQSNTLQYSGAYNSLYLVRNGVLTAYKADRMPIGIHLRMDEFTNQYIELEPGDTIYIFSDGYVDQLGGDKNRKFMTKSFKKLLEDIHKQPMHQQRNTLNDTIENWMGDQDQVDDILVLGVRF